MEIKNRSVSLGFALPEESDLNSNQLKQLILDFLKEIGEVKNFMYSFTDSLSKSETPDFKEEFVPMAEYNPAETTTGITKDTISHISNENDDSTALGKNLEDIGGQPLNDKTYLD